MSPTPRLLIPSVHKKILLPILAFFNSDKLNEMAGPRAVEPFSSVASNDSKIFFEEFFIGAFTKFVFSSPIDFILLSLFISFFAAFLAANNSSKIIGSIPFLIFSVI